MNKIQDSALFCCLIATVMLSLYNNSFDGMMGISAIGWAVVWSVAINIQSLSFVVYIMTKENELMKKLFAFAFIPYFTVKLFYDIAAYGQIHFFDPVIWVYSWDVIITEVLIVSLVYCFIMFRKWQK